MHSLNVEILSHPVIQSKHLILHGEINFSIPSPPPYKRKIWEYNRANYLHIMENLVKIDWENLFLNENIDSMTKRFSDHFLKVMFQYIPNKIITCNDKDAPWITSEVKTAIKRNSKVHRKWVLRGAIPMIGT